MKARVYLATTAGPVRIERLTRERAQQSAVCLGRTTKVLAVSADYDAFVRQPSGVIEREFSPAEPGAFRLDVDGPIDDGDSWQLGVFAAHMLARDHALAGPGDEQDRAIWLTGAVHNDLSVAPVDHIPEKLRASRDAFAALAEMGVPLMLVLPPGGAGLAAGAGLPGDVAIVEVATTKELEAAIGMIKPRLTADRRPANAAAGGKPAHGWRWALLAAAISVLALGVLAALVLRERDRMGRLAFDKGWPALAADMKKAESDGWIRGMAAALLRRELRADLPAEGADALQIHERRAPEGQTCAAVHFGNAEAVLVPVGQDPNGDYQASDRGGLCGLAFALAADPARIHAVVRFEVLSGRFIHAGSVLDPRSGALVFSGPAAWTIDLPRRPDGPFAYTIELLASRRSVNFDILAMAGAAEDLAGLGILYRAAEHRAER